ncbi:MAG: glycoside hydrolase family 57 protein [Candidatus Binatia bacterium]
MANVCFYFQVHQPFRLRRYRVFDVGRSHDYFDDDKNREVLQKVARKCYLPATSILLDLVRRHEGRFRVSYSVSGTALEQIQRWAPEVLSLFRELAATGCVEFIAETSHHSLAFFYDRAEFEAQVRLQRGRIERLLGVAPTVFRNTELIYQNDLARTVEALGFRAILAEGADHVLGWRSPNWVYRPEGCRELRLLMRNYRLSDDVAFRFSQRAWDGWPLTAPKYAEWLAPIQGDTVNLFMDYETLGEHQWEETGIFDFLRRLPDELLSRGVGFHLPSEAARIEPRGTVDVHDPLSWADVERDLSAWLGNRMQQAAMHQLYALLPRVTASGDAALLETWRKLSTSDHFYYMCTKWFADGDVHKYFNPYDSPYECFIAFMNVLTDLDDRLEADASPAARPRGSRAA